MPFYILTGIIIPSHQSRQQAIQNFAQGLWRGAASPTSALEMTTNNPHQEALNLKPTMLHPKPWRTPRTFAPSTEAR